MSASPRRVREAVYRELARISRAAASPRRLELIELLAQAPCTVEALARGAGLSVANTSQHLQVLRTTRLVVAEKRGLFVRCRLAGEEVADYSRTLRALVEARTERLHRIAARFAESRGRPVQRLEPATASVPNHRNPR